MWVCWVNLFWFWGYSDIHEISSQNDRSNENLCVRRCCVLGSTSYLLGVGLGLLKLFLTLGQLVLILLQLTLGLGQLGLDL